MIQRRQHPQNTQRQEAFKNARTTVTKIFTLYPLRGLLLKFEEHQPESNVATSMPRYKDASSSERAVIPTVDNHGVSVLQLTNAKFEVIRQLADSGIRNQEYFIEPNGRQH